MFKRKHNANLPEAGSKLNVTLSIGREVVQSGNPGLIIFKQKESVFCNNCNLNRFRHGLSKVKEVITLLNGSEHH